jgi:hypothetical protein
VIAHGQTAIVHHESTAKMGEAAMDSRCGMDAPRFMKPKELKPLQSLTARGWKSPEPLRLHRIEEWRRDRFERMFDQVSNDADRRKAYRAAMLYTEVACRLDGCALTAVTTYRDAA